MGEDRDATTGCCKVAGRRVYGTTESHSGIAQSGDRSRTSMRVLVNRARLLRRIGVSDDKHVAGGIRALAERGDEPSQGSVKTPFRVSVHVNGAEGIV